MHTSENDAVLISVSEPLNHIDQDTKSARLIAVCKRGITLNKFGKRARDCCVHVFLVYAIMSMLWSREVLYGHSITGKSSNTYKGKDAKTQLDPEKVDSICGEYYFT